MKKKKGIKFIAFSLIFGLCALTACKNQGGTGSKQTTTAEETSPETKPSETPSESTPNTSSEQPEYVGVKLYVNGVETVLTSPTIELDYGTDYLNSIQIKAVKADGTEVDVTSESNIETEITNESNAGNYTATISYGDFQAVTVNVVIKKANIEVKTFTVQSKVEDGTACIVNYEISNGATPKLYYKAKGAEDSTYTETAPVLPGLYVCKLVVEESTNYNGVEATKEFTITDDIRVIKAYIGYEEVTSTNNTIKFKYNDGYDFTKKIVVMDVTGLTPVKVENFTVTTDLTATSALGTYTATIKFKKSNEITVNVVVEKGDLDIERFTVKSRPYNKMPIAL